MKKLIFLLSVLLSSLHLFAQDGVTTSNVNLRSEPTTSSAILGNIPKGTIVDLGDCQSGWCHISGSGYDGYISKRYTRLASDNNPASHEKMEAHPTEPVRHYQNSKGNTVQSPTHYDAVPDGATAVCRDGSYSFSQSRRGTCSHHGGVSRWLK
jgi:uncharacterized protein YraI